MNLIRLLILMMAAIPALGATTGGVAIPSLPSTNRANALDLLILESRTVGTNSRTTKITVTNFADSLTNFGYFKGTNGGGGGTSGDTNMATYVATNLLAQTQRGISNVVYISTRTDGRDGIGTMEDPRDGSSNTKLSNIVFSVRSGSHVYFLPGTYQVVAQLQTLSSQDSGHTNAPLKVYNKQNIVFEGIGKPVLNTTTIGEIFSVWNSTNIIHKGIVMDQNRAATGTNALLFAMIGYNSPTKLMAVIDCEFLNYANHGIVPWGVEANHDGHVYEDNYFFNGGNTNHPTLNIDGVAIAAQARNSRIVNNRMESVARGVEFYVYNNSGYPVQNTLVANNVMDDIWQFGVCAFNDSVQSSNLLGNSVMGNVIGLIDRITVSAGAMAQTNRSSGIMWAAGSLGTKITGNTIIGSQNNSYHDFGVDFTTQNTASRDFLIDGNLVYGAMGSAGVQVYGNVYTSVPPGIFYGSVFHNYVADAEVGFVLSGFAIEFGNNKVRTAFGAAFQFYDLEQSSIFNNRTLFSGTATASSTTTNNIFKQNYFLNNTLTDNGVRNIMDNTWPYDRLRLSGNAGVYNQMLQLTNTSGPNKSWSLNHNDAGWLSWYQPIYNTYGIIQHTNGNVSLGDYNSGNFTNYGTVLLKGNATNASPSIMLSRNPTTGAIEDSAVPAGGSVTTNFNTIASGSGTFGNVTVTNTLDAGQVTASNLMITFLTVPVGIANSNLTLNFNIASQDVYLTNSTTAFTNLVGLVSTNQANITLRITPEGANRTVTWPTLGGSSFGARFYTNANSPIWTTITNPVVVSMSAWGTNVHISMSEWK